LVRARRELIHSSSWIVLSVKTCLFFVFLLAATAIGQESKTDAIDKQINALFENAKSRSEEQAAYDKGLALWDKEMNRVYGELMKGLSKEAASLLKKSQRTWLAFRSQQVAYLDEFYNAFSGTEYLTAHAYAVMDGTRQRTLSLAKQLKYIDAGDYVND
jgi:uncharacterized protein YecT (DUF1311 family)